MVNNISRETFEQMDRNSRDMVLFDFHNDTKEALNRVEVKLDKKFRIDTGLAAITGFIGGVIAHLTQLTLFGNKG